jgi:hypothetical protein
MDAREASSAYRVFFAAAKPTAGGSWRESMKAPMRVGAHIEGVHWIAEYTEATHEIRVFREGRELDVYDAPRSMFGEEAQAGSPNEADNRAHEAALLASLRRYVAERDAEE